MRPSVFRNARLGRGLAIEDVAGRAGLPLAIAGHIDAGQFEHLPPGVYARSFVRAFAGAVGLDPREALEAVGSDLPAEPDPFPLLREIARTRPPDSVLQLATEWLDHWMGARPAARRHAAACVDAVILLGFSASLTALTAWFCAVGVPALMEAAGGVMSLLYILVWAIYFLFSAIGNLTPGLWLCSAAPSGASCPLRLPEVLRRAQRLWLDECSILVNLMAAPRATNSLDRDRPAAA